MSPQQHNHIKFIHHLLQAWEESCTCDTHDVPLVQDKATARYAAFRDKYGLREAHRSKGSSTPSAPVSRTSFVSSAGHLPDSSMYFCCCCCCCWWDAEK